MPSIIRDEKGKVDEIDLLNLFQAPEGSIEQYYGKVGNGKTANGTYDIIQDLMEGKVVYANWILNWEGFDERQSLFHLFRGLLFPWAKRYYKFRKENLKYIEIDDKFIDNFEKITDATVYLDEGHVAFDSYEMAKMSLRKRKAVLHTRHFNRTLKILSQRPTAIHVSLRANVNVFYKCEKVASIPFLGIVFRRTEFQELERENVDETRPESVNLRLISYKVLGMYDSKYMRKGQEPSQHVAFDAYDLTYKQRLFNFFSILFLNFFPLKRKKIGEKLILPISEKIVKVEEYHKKSLGDNVQSTTIKKLDQGGPNSSSSAVDQLGLPF